MTNKRKQALIAVLFGALAVVCVFAYTASVKSEAAMARAASIQQYGGERVQVVVAAENISVGDTISESNTIVQEWLVDLLPQGTPALELSAVDGLVAQVEILKNEPVMLERVGNTSSRINVPQGLSAVSVSSSDVLAVGGAISVGSVVDVYVETEQGTVTLLGENILVLETSTATDSSDEQVSWVTLAVTPESVRELITASTLGTIHFVLPSSTAAS